MTKLMVRIHNGSTNEIIYREMNDAELAQYKIDQAESVAQKATEEENAAAKSELLAKLGITADEAALLLG